MMGEIQWERKQDEEAGRTVRGEKRHKNKQKQGKGKKKENNRNVWEKFYKGEETRLHILAKWFSVNRDTAASYSTAGHWNSNAKHTGKADNQIYKQSAHQAVAKEVKSYFPWIISSQYAWSVK